VFRTWAGARVRRLGSGLRVLQQSFAINAGLGLPKHYGNRQTVTAWGSAIAYPIMTAVFYTSALLPGHPPDCRNAAQVSQYAAIRHIETLQFQRGIYVQPAYCRKPYFAREIQQPESGIADKEKSTGKKTHAPL